MINQNTPQWLEMRKNKIGSSDAPIVMGVSPWKTPYQLWKEKLDLSKSQATTPAMQRGHDLEDRARQQLEHMTGLFFLPQVKLHPTREWMMASLDAVDPEGRHIAEIKCPNTTDHQLALAGQVPEKYIPQLQHQLEVCQLEMAFYFSFDGTSGVIVKIFRDDKYIKKMLLQEKEFWEKLQSIEPPELTERDYVVMTNEMWEKRAIEFLEARQKRKQWEEIESQAEQDLLFMAQQQNAIGSGVKVTHFVRKGNVDYKKIPELKDVNLEHYRKPALHTHRITAM